MTRTGKIARLPLAIREQLNHRLSNGETGRTILKWLNDLTETKQMLTELFEAKPITQQNLSEWRLGGYKEWLQHQQRLEWFARLTEQDVEIQKHDASPDAHEAMGRYFLVEIGQAFAQMQEIKNPNERFARFERLTDKFTKLQNSFNWSRAVHLTWRKHKDHLKTLGWQEPASPATRPTPLDTEADGARLRRALEEPDRQSPDQPAREPERRSPDRPVPAASAIPELETQNSPQLAIARGKIEGTHLRQAWEAQPETPSQPGLRPDHSTATTPTELPLLLGEKDGMRASVNLESPGSELPNSQLLNSQTAAATPQPETPNSKPEAPDSAPLDTRLSSLVPAEGAFAPIPTKTTPTPTTESVNPPSSTLNPPFAPPQLPNSQLPNSQLSNSQTCYSVRSRHSRCLEG